MPDIPAPSIPAPIAPSPAPTVQPVNVTAPAPTVAPTPKETPRPQPKILSVREALGLKEDPKKTRETMEARQKAMLDPKPAKPKPAPKPKAETAPAVPDNPEVELEGTAAAAPVAAPAAKFKIGDKEMTAEEVAAHIAALEAKSAKIETPPTAKEEPKPVASAEVKPPDAPTQTEEELDAEFIDRHATEFETPAEEADAALASGKGIVTGKTMARALLETRRWISHHFSKLKEELAGMEPAMQIARSVQEHQSAQNFLAAHTDISAHPDAARVRSEVDADLKANFDKVQRMLKANVADAQDMDFAKAYSADYGALLAFNTRKRLGLPIDGSGKPVPAVAAPPAAEPKPEAPRPAPPTGQRPGGAGSPEAVNPQRAAILRARAGSVG